ncbi:MAG TPA: GxxExxY protein, partial [Anaerolineae bacterium]|nr:GxxExxY protein [Anaerolineae bacterium]
HFALGPGFLHQVYRRATMIELHHQRIPYEYIKQVPIYYDQHHLGNQPARLIAVDEKILLAAIAVRELDDSWREMLKARLRFLGYRLGFLANFHGTTLQIVPVRIRSIPNSL